MCISIFVHVRLMFKQKYDHTQRPFSIFIWKGMINHNVRGIKTCNIDIDYSLGSIEDSI